MAPYTTEQLRTVALVGHGAVGKTTLAEALLSRCGALGAAGICRIPEESPLPARPAARLFTPYAAASAQAAE